jgi:hypothetical protein
MRRLDDRIHIGRLNLQEKLRLVLQVALSLA